MRPPLTLAVAQPLCHPHDVAANAAAHASIVAKAGARVVVFPELSLTGYHFDTEPVGIGDHRLAPLVETCDRHEVLALAGAPVTDNRHRSIAVLAVDGGGVSIAYRKMFLGAAETAVFRAGSEPSALEVGGWRLGLAVCRDTGVTAHADATVALGIDVYAAGVLESADEADVQPRRARTVVARHGVWVAVASFAGSTGEGYDRAAGGSEIVNPNGRTVASAGPDVGAWASAVLMDGPRAGR